jgi:hypothetical protein
MRQISMCAFLLGMIAIAPQTSAQSPIKVFLGVEAGTVPIAMQVGLEGLGDVQSTGSGWTIGGEAGVQLPILGIKAGGLYRRDIGSADILQINWGMDANEWGLFAEVEPIPIPIVQLGIGLSVTDLSVDDTWSGWDTSGELTGSDTATRLYVYGGIPFIKKATLVVRLGYNWASPTLESDTPLPQDLLDIFELLQVSGGTLTGLYDGGYISAVIRYNIVG